METNCIHRGDKWKPKWIIKNALKYNDMHPDKKPNQDIVNSDPPLCQATWRYQASAAIIENKEDHGDQLEHENIIFKTRKLLMI